jgi:hypothetical protein
MLDEPDLDLGNLFGIRNVKFCTIYAPGLANDSGSQLFQTSSTTFRDIGRRNPHYGAPGGLGQAFHFRAPSISS